MKKYILTSVIAFILLVISATAFAQRPNNYSYPTSPVTITYGAAVNITPNRGGGSAANAFALNPAPALLPGLTFNTGTGVISGTPTGIAAATTYTVTPSNGSGNGTAFTVRITVNKAALTINANDANKVYGTALTGAPGSTAFTATGLVNGETIGSVTLAYAGGAGAGAPANANVGNYNNQISASNAVGGTFTANNYTITYNTNRGNITVTPKPLTANITFNNKTYDATTTAMGTGTLNGVLAGDNVTLAVSGNFATKNVGTGIGVTSTSTLGGADAGNYTLTQPTGLTATITAKALVVTATGPTKTYGTALTVGASTTNFTANGEAGAENVTSVTLTPNAAGLSATTPAGTAYVVVPSAPTGTGGFLASNYTITFNNYNGTVAKAALNINVNNVTHTYGTAITSPGAGATTGYTPTGLQNGETIGSATINYGTGATATSGAGTYANQVILTNPTGGTFNANNYNITINNGDIVVNQANLTITATTTKVYGTSANAFFTNLGPSNFTVTGLVNGETVTQVNFVNINNGAAGTAANSPVGSTYTALPGNGFGGFPPQGTGGFNANNYNITYNANTVTVIAAPMTITATGPTTKVYGTTLTTGPSTANFTATAGAIAGETVTSVTLTPSGPGIAATAPVGSAYTETPSAATGTGGFLASNYNITYVPFTTGVVTAAPLTITATPVIKPYGTTLTSGPSTTGFTSAGLVAGETITSVNLTYTGAAIPTNAAIGSTGTVTPGPNVTGPGTFNSSNYTITFNAGAVTVGAAIFDWIGANSTDWATPGNWSVNGIVQTSTYPGLNEATDVVRIAVIPYVITTNQPLLSANPTNSIASLTIGNSEPSTLSLTSPAALTITGNLTLNTGSNFTLNGPSGTALNIGTDFVNNGGTFTNAATAGIFISGTFTNTGTNNFGTALITFNNPTTNPGTPIVLTTTGTQLFTNVLFTGQGHYQFRKSGAGNASFSIASTGVLTVAGSVNLTPASASLDLLSDANGAASVAPVPAGCTITNVNVQRFIPGALNGGQRGYRLISSPVNAGVTDASGNSIYSINYLMNTTYISGTGFTPSATVKQGNPSLYLLRENLAPQYTTFLNSNYRAISVISASPNYTLNPDGGPFNIPVGNGYLFFFRGGVGTTVNPFVSTSTPGDGTLVANGTLNTGQIIVHDWYTPASANLGYTTVSGDPTIEGFNLVGNPYACAIDLETTNSTDQNTGIYTSNVSPFVYELNPRNSNYAVYTIGSGGSVPPTNGATQYIASGQGYLVQATGTGAQYIFNESAKSVGTQVIGPNLMMGKPADLATNIQYMRLQMAMDTVNSDETIISFDKSTKALFDVKEDALYRVGSGKVSISSISADKKSLAVNRMPLSQKIVTIPLNVSATANGTYSLNMNSIKGIPQLYDIWLMDAYRNDSLDMRHNSTYRFDVIKTDTASFGAYRFKLILRQNPAFAYHLLNFTAQKATGKEVQLGWVTEHEANYTNFTVERSTDGGKTFTVVGGVPATGAGIYALLDKYPGNDNLYRLKQEDINDSITYSHIIPVSFSNLSNNLASNNINVYPNPTTSGLTLVVNSAVNNAPAYNFTITNSYGLMIRQGTSNQSNWQTNVSDLLPGTYVIQVINSKDQSFIGKTKFVKL